MSDDPQDADNPIPHRPAAQRGGVAYNQRARNMKPDDWSEDLTFRDLGIKEGLKPDLDPAPADGEFPLQEWFRAVYEKPLGEFSLHDVARACAQGLYVEYIVPLALDALGDDPLAGDLYDGDLMSSLSSVPADFWRTHELLRDSLLAIVKPFLAELDEEREIAERLLKKLKTGGASV